MTDGLRRYQSVLADSSRWQGFTFRPDDIVISAPSKCGTTWMQMITALLIFRDPNLPGRLTELSPWMDVQTDTVDNVFAALAAQRHRRFIKTHTPLDGLPYDERVTYVCVGRDPRDAAISWGNHRDNMNREKVLAVRDAVVGSQTPAGNPPPVLPRGADDPVQRFWQWVDEDAPPDKTPSSLRALLYHLATFWDRREAANVLLFHYADLQADLGREMRRLATALDIELDDGLWPVLVPAATFDRMRRRADDLAPQVAVEGFWHDNAQFFNRGASGQWRSLLGPDYLARYDTRVHQLAPPDLAAWVHAGWR